MTPRTGSGGGRQRRYQWWGHIGGGCQQPAKIFISLFESSSYGPPPHVLFFSAAFTLVFFRFFWPRRVRLRGGFVVAVVVVVVEQGGGEFGRSMYLQLSQSEATAGTDTAVVLDGRASHDRSELVDGTGRDGGGLSLASNASRGLLAGLYSTNKFTCQIRSVKKSTVQPFIADAAQCFFAALLLFQNPPLVVGWGLHSRAYLVEVALNPTLPVLSEV